VRLRKTLGPMTASTAALARMTISDTVKIVSGKFADPLPPPPSQFVCKAAQDCNDKAGRHNQHQPQEQALALSHRSYSLQALRATYAAHTRFRPACFAAYKAWSAILMRSKIVFILELACATPMLTVAVMAYVAIDNALASTC
jgi:hypothetical protein